MTTNAPPSSDDSQNDKRRSRIASGKARQKAIKRNTDDVQAGEAQLTALIAAGPTAVGILKESLDSIDGIQYFLTLIPVTTAFAGFVAIWKFISVLSTYPFLTGHHELPSIFAHRGLTYALVIFATSITAIAWILLGSALAAAQTIAIGAVVPYVFSGSAAYVLTLVGAFQMAAVIIGWKEYRLGALTEAAQQCHCTSKLNEAPLLTTIQSVNMDSKHFHLPSHPSQPVTRANAVESVQSAANAREWLAQNVIGQQHIIGQDEPYEYDEDEKKEGDAKSYSYSSEIVSFGFDRRDIKRSGFTATGRDALDIGRDVLNRDVSISIDSAIDRDDKRSSIGKDTKRSSISK